MLRLLIAVLLPLDTSEKLRREDEQRKIAHELQKKQLNREIAQLRSESEHPSNRERNRVAVEEVGRRPWSENARLAELDAKIAALWPSPTSSSPPTLPPDNPSPP